MKHLKNPFVIIGIVMIVILAFVFYWFQLRPMQIKKECARKAADLMSTTASSADFNFLYSTCLHGRGL